MEWWYCEIIGRCPDRSRADGSWWHNSPTPPCCIIYFCGYCNLILWVLCGYHCNLCNVQNPKVRQSITYPSDGQFELSGLGRSGSSVWGSTPSVPFWTFWVSDIGGLDIQGLDFGGLNPKLLSPAFWTFEVIGVCIFGVELCPNVQNPNVQKSTVKFWNFLTFGVSEIPVNFWTIFFGDVRGPIFDIQGCSASVSDVWIFGRLGFRGLQVSPKVKESWMSINPEYL